MYYNTVVILADLNEFPHAQYYAACFGVLFSDIGRRDRLKAYKPDRYDYTKVYIASKNTHLIEKFKATHAAFDVSVYDDIPDYTGQEVRKVASMLVANSYVDPFDDLITMRERDAKQAALEKAVREAEKEGKFLDPNPDAKLDPSIKLVRKGSFSNA